MNGDLYYLAAIAGKPLPCAKPARRDTAGGGAGVLRARNVMLIVRPAMDRSDPSSQADPATADGPLAGPLAGLACWVVTDGKAGMEIQCLGLAEALRSEEHTSELQALMRNSFAVFCLKKKKK